MVGLAGNPIDINRVKVVCLYEQTSRFNNL